MSLANRFVLRSFKNSYAHKDSFCCHFADVLLGRLMSPLFFAQFLRLRYYMSPQTRAAFSYVSAQIDTITAHPSCPGVVRTGMNVARDLVSCDSVARIALADPFAQGATIQLKRAAARSACRKCRSRWKCQCRSGCTLIAATAGSLRSRSSSLEITHAQTRLSTQRQCVTSLEWNIVPSFRAATPSYSLHVDIATSTSCTRYSYRMSDLRAFASGLLMACL